MGALSPSVTPRFVIDGTRIAELEAVEGSDGDVSVRRWPADDILPRQRER